MVDKRVRIALLISLCLQSDWLILDVRYLHNVLREDVEAEACFRADEFIEEPIDT